MAFGEPERQSQYEYHFGTRAEYIENFLIVAGLKFEGIDVAALWEPIVETLHHAGRSFLSVGFEYLVSETGVSQRKAGAPDAKA